MRLRGGCARWLPCIALALPIGCGTAGTRGGPPSSPAAASQAPGAATAEDAVIQSALFRAQQDAKADYRIAATDLLEIDVYREQDLHRSVRVSQNGGITFPLIGSVTVAGLTISEAEAAIAGKLREFLVSPQVSILVKEYSTRQIYVLGEVAKPGSYALPSEARLTVLEAITTAGGFTAIAAKDRTRVVRKANGSSKTIPIEVSAIMKGEKDRDIPLEPNDVIYVPQSFF